MPLLTVIKKRIASSCLISSEYSISPLCIPSMTEILSKNDRSDLMGEIRNIMHLSLDVVTGSAAVDVVISLGVYGFSKYLCVFNLQSVRLSAS